MSAVTRSPYPAVWECPPPEVLPVGIDAEGGSGIEDLSCEFTLSGNELVNHLTLSFKQLLKRVVREGEHRRAYR
jgi:hypothetical protein